MPRGIAGDDHEPTAIVLAEQSGEVARALVELHRDGVWQEVREPVQRYSGSDVRFRHELENEDRACDRDVAGDLERSPSGLRADLAVGGPRVRRRCPATDSRYASGGVREAVLGEPAGSTARTIAA